MFIYYTILFTNYRKRLYMACRAYRSSGVLSAVLYMRIIFGTFVLRQI